MLKWTIVKKSHLKEKEQRIQELETENKILEIRIQDTFKRQAKEMERIKKIHEEEVKRMEQQVEEQAKEKAKKENLAKKRRQAEINKKKKWLNGYPDEDFKVDKL